MSKFKAFFKKIKDYIKNTAWIQPILIVIVIFVVLFSLNPLTTAIKNGWTKLTSVNKMETISYGEYVEKVINNLSIIEEYINTAEPVSSGTLVEKYELDFSSATIRNDMAILEELGLLQVQLLLDVLGQSVLVYHDVHGLVADESFRSIPDTFILASLAP